MKRTFTWDIEHKDNRGKKAMALILILFLLCGTTLQAAKQSKVKATGPSDGDIAIINDETPALAASVSDAIPTEAMMDVTLPTPEEVADMGNTSVLVNGEVAEENNSDGNVQNDNSETAEPAVQIIEDPVALQQSVAQLATDLNTINAQLVAVTTTTTGNGGAAQEITSSITEISAAALDAAQTAVDKMGELTVAQDALQAAEATLETAQSNLTASQEELDQAMAAYTAAQEAYTLTVEDAKKALADAQAAAVAASNVKYEGMKALVAMSQNNDDAYSQELMAEFKENVNNTKHTLTGYMAHVSNAINSTGKNYGTYICQAMEDQDGGYVEGLAGTAYTWRVYKTDGKKENGYNIFWVEQDINQLEKGATVTNVYKYNTETGKLYLLTATVDIDTSPEKNKYLNVATAECTEVTTEDTSAQNILDSIQNKVYTDALASYNQEAIDKATADLETATANEAALTKAETALGTAMDNTTAAAQDVMDAATAVDEAATDVETIVNEIQTAVDTATAGGATVTVDTAAVEEAQTEATEAKETAEAATTTATEVIASTPATTSETVQATSSESSSTESASSESSTSSSTSESSSSDNSSSSSSSSESDASEE